MGLSVDFQPNFLDRFDLTTYHIIFYMLPPNRPYNFDALDPAGGAIIAETGVTGQVSIDNLFCRTFTAIAGNSGSRGTANEKITFTLKEHNGATLFDKIKYTGAKFNPPMETVSGVYYIEITFKANNFPNSSDAVTLPMAFRWPINITSIDAQITSSGASYDVVAYHLASAAGISNAAGTNGNGPIVLDMARAAQANAASEAQIKKDNAAKNKLAAKPTPVPYIPGVTPQQSNTASARATAQENSRLGSNAATSAISKVLTPTPNVQFSKLSINDPRLGKQTFRNISTFGDISGRVDPNDTFVAEGDFEPIDRPGEITTITETTRTSNGKLVQTEVAPNPAVANIGFNLETHGNDTIGYTLLSLQGALNQRSIESGLPTQYNIRVEDKIAKMRMHPQPSIDGGKTKSMEPNAQDRWVITFEQDMGVDEMINRVLSASPDYQAYSVNSPIANGKTATPGDLKNVHSISVLMAGNDAGTVLPSNTQTPEWLVITVGEYKTSVMTSRADLAATPEQVVASAVGAGLLRKRYFYLFTGQNDQVINLDLKFNFAWYVNLPNNQGWTTDTGSNAVGEVAWDTPAHVDDQKVNQTNNPVAAAVKGTNTVQNLLNQNAAFAKRNIGNLPAAAILPVPVFNPAKDVGIIAQQIQKTQRLQEVSLTQRSTVKYVEDAFNEREYQPGIKFMSTASVNPNTNLSKTTSQSTESPKGQGKAYANGLFAAAFNAQSGDLSNIEMKIKGDPYWLGESTTGLPIPTETGAAFFVLSVKSQTLYDTNTGLAPPLQPYANGLYMVSTIDHEFSGGVFTQTLSGHIDPMAQDLQLSD